MSASRSLLLPFAIAAALLVASDAVTAQSGRQGYLERRADERRDVRGDKIEEARQNYPDAVRKEPGLRATSRFQRQINAMVKAFEEEDFAKALELSTAISGDARANAFEKAVAFQVAGNVAMEQGNDDAAIAAFRSAVESNGLDNNAHFATMLNLANVQVQADRFEDGIATLEAMIAESRTQRPDVFAALGSYNFQAERYPAAAQALEKAISLADGPRPDWERLLQKVYFDAGQYAEAARVGERLLAREPDDKRTLFELANVYLEMDQADKAIALLEGARTRGLLTEARDYQSLYTLYFNAGEREKEVVAVIEEGLAKGVLKRDLQTLNVLAQAAYFSDDMAKAIAGYTEAAALDPTGEAGLNLAKVLSGEGEDAKARDAARAALAKGVSNPGDAWMVIARSEALLDNRAGARAALQEAAKYAETRDQANRMLQQMR